VLGRPAARIAAADTDVHFLCVGMTEWRRHCRVAAASSAHHRTYRLFTDDDDDDCPPNYTTAQHALPLWRSASREHFTLDTFFLSFFLLSFFSIRSGGLSHENTLHNCHFIFLSYFSAADAFSALTLLVGRQEGHPACKKTEQWGAGVVICLEQGADLQVAQLMPLPLTVSCFSNRKNPGARFTKYLTTILRLSYDNAKVTINLRRTSNLQNILQ